MIRPASLGLAVLIASNGAAGAVTFEAAMTARIAAVERLISALAIETKQESSSTSTGLQAENASYRALASSMGEVDRAFALREAQKRYESMTTAVAGACADTSASKQAALADVKVSTIMDNLADQEKEWAADGGNRVDVMAGTQSVRESYFCSDSEKGAGLCDSEAHSRFGGVPAGDSDVAPFMLRMNDDGVRSYGDVEAQAGMVYMDNLLPLPTMPSKSDAASVGVVAQMRRAEAMRQMAIISLGRAQVGNLIARGLEGGTDE